MVDYKTIVSTTDSKVTLMQWLQSLAKEFDNAKITDIAFTNDGNSSLTFTFTLTDGTTKTATCKAVTLTDDEKAIVSGLVGQVATSTDGITFNKAVTFVGNIVAKGNEIHNGYASFLGDESHAGTEIHKGQSTFTDLRTDDITATDGQDLLSYDGTNTALKGKADRPLYNENELALKSDVTDLQSDKWNELYAIAGTGAYRSNKVFMHMAWETPYIEDAMAKYYTNCSYYLCNASVRDQTNELMTSAVKFKNPTTFFNEKCTNFTGMFIGFKNTGTLYLPSFTAATGSSGVYMFKDCKASKILVDTGCTVEIDYDLAGMFAECTNLNEVGTIHFTNGYDGNTMFRGCTKLKLIHCTGWNFSFNISASTQYERSGLLEVINNLLPVSTTQTLTMGATNLAKLTSDDILIATGKGWALA